MQSIQYGFLAKQSSRIYESPAFCLFEPAIWPIVECPPEGSKMILHEEKKSGSVRKKQQKCTDWFQTLEIKVINDFI